MRNMLGLRSKENGFTLVEVMVALAMMAIVLVAVYKMHHDSISMTNAARFHTKAPLLALKKMSEIEKMPLDEITDGAGDFGEDYSGYNWDVVIEDVESETLGSVAERIKKIDVRVTYVGDQMDFRLRLYKFF